MKSTIACCCAFAFGLSLQVARPVASKPPLVYAVPLVFLRAGLPPRYGSYAVVKLCASRHNTVFASPMNPNSFLNRLRAARARRLVVFVPGFATAPALGLPIAYGIAELLGRADLVIYADWGSAGEQYHYRSDSRLAKTNAPALAQFLVALHHSIPNIEIDVIAHSLGTRVVALAMPHIGSRADGRPVVKRAVLAAPDMALSDYLRLIGRDPKPFERVTLYVSRHDRALLLSSIIHLHHRLGRTTFWRHAIARTDVVDASIASTQRDGHGYAIHKSGLIRDIGLTLQGAPVPHPSWKREKPDAINWTYVGPTGNAAVDRCPRVAP